MKVNTPIRLLQVIPRFAPAWRYGGGVRVTYDLDEALVRRGFHVTVFTSDQIDEYTRALHMTEQMQGIDVRRFRNPVNAWASRASWLCYYPQGLKRALLEHVRDFDVVHVAEGRGPHVRWAFAAAERCGVPVVWSPLGGLADGVGIRKPYRRLYDFVYDTPRLVRSATAMIAQSAHEVGVVERFGVAAARIRTIGLGIETSLFEELPARGLLRRTLGIGPATPVVLFVGRLHPTKGLDVLLEAAALARREFPSLHVVLVGWDHGALRTVRRLTRWLKLGEVVHILAPAFDLARIQAYVDADVFAVASNTFEETSLAALEALAAGTPCVVTRQCEVPGLVSAGAGVVTESDVGSFAGGLRAVLGMPGFKAGALEARRSILESQTADCMAAAYARVFEDAAASAERST